MTEWSVRRWARYGHERLYVETPGGTALGYLDLKTGRYHSDDVANLPLLERAIADHLARTQPAPPAAPGPKPTPTVPEVGPDERLVRPAVPQTPKPEWTDLSSTRAGAAARDRAMAEREAQGRLRHTVARLTGAKTDERAWRIGADGEEAVASQLAKLGPQWRVLHAVRVGNNGSDIDHVVIGPTGVFTVNAKHHPRSNIWVGGDTFLVNGQRLPYVRNSRHEASRAARVLTDHAGFPVEAVGVIAVMGAHNGFTIKRQPEDGTVVVVPRKRISQVLARLKPRLSAREIDAIYDVARRSSTWR